jgi:hypothetical protein
MAWRESRAVNRAFKMRYESVQNDFLEENSELPHQAAPNTGAS